MVIRYNMQAMFASRNLKINTLKDSKTVERLSSGYRINRAADDAAGLSISEKLRWYARGLRQNVRNIQDGISLIQVADGALSEVHSMLHRMNELSVQAANDTNTNADREALQNEIEQIKSDINRISTDTTFNNDIVVFKPTKTPQIKGNPNDIMVYHEDYNGRVREGGIFYNGRRYAYGTDFIVKEDANGNIVAGEYVLDAKGGDGRDKQIPITFIYEGGSRVPSARKYVLEPKDDGIYIDEILHAWNTIKRADGTALDPQNIQEGTYSFQHAGLTISFDVEPGTDLGSLKNELKADGLETYSLQSGDLHSPSFYVNPNIGMTNVSVDASKRNYIPGSTTSNTESMTDRGYRMHADDSGVYMYLDSRDSNGQGQIKFDTMTWEQLRLNEWKSGVSLNPSSTVSHGESNNGYSYHDSMTNTTISFTVDSEISKQELIDAINNWQIDVTTNNRMEFAVSGGGSDISIGSHSQNLDAYGTQYLMGRTMDTNDPLILQSGMVLAKDPAADGLSFTMQDANGQTYTFVAGNVENSVRSRVESYVNDYINRYISSYRSYLNNTQGGTNFGGVSYSDRKDTITFREQAHNYSVGINYTTSINGWLSNSDFTYSRGAYNQSTGRYSYSVSLKSGSRNALETKKNNLINSICNALEKTNISVKTDDGPIVATTTVRSPNRVYNARYGSQVIAGDREVKIQTGPLEMQGTAIKLPSMNTGILSIGGVNVTTSEGASAAIASVAKVLNKVSDMRSQYGAAQNRLEHAMAVNQINAENTTAAESRLRDADMAKEMMEHARNRILIQAGQSILAQSNHSSDNILSLLLGQ